MPQPSTAGTPEVDTTSEDHMFRHLAKFNPVRFLVPLVGIVASAGLVLQASSAAFSSTTSNQVNSFAAGTVVLVDDDGGSTAMLNVSNMVPGDSSAQCIELSYTGSSFQIDPVKMYTTLANETNSFASVLDIKVEVGSGATFGDCSTFTPASTLFDGTLASMAGLYPNYASSLDVYTPAAGSTTRAVRLTVTLQSTAPDTAQGGTADATFTWEVHSN